MKIFFVCLVLFFCSFAFAEETTAITIECKSSSDKCRISLGDGSPGTPNTDIPAPNLSNHNNEITKACDTLVKKLFGSKKSC